MQSDESKRQIDEEMREFFRRFPPETPFLLLPTNLMIDSLAKGLWRGVIETSGDFPIHLVECDYNGLRPCVILPLSAEVKRGVKASVGRAIRDDWLALEDLRALKIIEPDANWIGWGEDPPKG